jgi:hypothetical protein
MVRGYPAAVNSSRTKSRVAGWLGHPRAGWTAVAFALLIFVPSLSLGFFADDYALIDLLEHRFPRIVPWWDLYRFSPNDASSRSTPGCRHGSR